MAIRATVYENGDHTCLIWFPSDLRPIPECRGFGILRKVTKADGSTSQCYVANHVGFSDDATPPQTGKEWQWPIQRFLWWDYAVSPGDTVSYQVIPVVGPVANLGLAQDQASPFTTPLQVTGQVGQHLEAYFNRGIIAAQWVARELAAEAKKQQGQKTTMTEVISTVGDPLRNALGGLLRRKILESLDEVAASGGSIYAALYELNDPELIGRFKTLGARVNLILANGAFKASGKDEPANAKTRAELKKLHTVKVYNRMVSSGHFAHNKFVVFCDAQGTPHRVLTGSTNWTLTGLCTQANNGLFIEDGKVASAYLDQWNRLKAAKNGFPPSLKQAASQQKSFTVDDAEVTVWFVPTTKQQDLVHARTLIENAKNGALFLFFNPGAFEAEDDKQTLLQTIVDRGREGTPHYDGTLYIRGVVNQKITGLTDDQHSAKASAKKKSGRQPPPTGDEHDSAHDPQAPTTPVLLYGGAQQSGPTRAPKDVLVPAAIKAKFHDWDKELLSMGVMVHSKVIVLDPFGDHPVLMTGSHNLGTKASRANDDNLVIVEGPGARAAAISYAVNIIAIFQEYRWRAYVAAHTTDSNVWHGLQDDDKWQEGHLENADLDELRFWSAGANIAAQLYESKAATVAQSTTATAAQRAAKPVASASSESTTAPPKSSSRSKPHRAGTRRRAARKTRKVAKHPRPRRPTHRTSSKNGRRRKRR
jgi:phosphatidylserine/phosphatidylglycerophosphate/cardiolipin synthase-like enzyme